MRMVLTVLVFLLIAAPAQAETAIRFWDGPGPVFTAAAEAGAGETAVRVVEWRACPPDGSPCSALPESAYSQTWRCTTPARSCSLTAGLREAAPGTVFEAVFDTDGVITTRRTAMWLGPVSASVPPMIVRAEIGRVVSVAPGSWDGGFAAAPEVPAALRSFHELTACRGADGTDCFWLERDTPIPARFAGFYAYVDESSYYEGQWSRLFCCVIGDRLPPAPRRERLGPLSSMQSRSAPSQICCVPPAPATPGPPEARPPSPSASVRARAYRRNGRLHVARVSCALRCAVRLTVTSARGTYARSLSVRGTRSLSIPPRRGQLRVRVAVDGKLLASGRSRAR
jgi:hypothetical protein